MSTQTTGSKIGNVMRVSSGNFLEMYDFMVYAYYASYIAREIFPSSNAYASMMMTLGTFGAGYLMRPLGAVVLGAYVDRHGRRTGLILTLFLMAIGTLVIACTPAYRTIGIIAPIVVLLGRLLQGFSAGVEVGGACIYLSEMATPGHRGFYCAWQSASQQVAVVFAALLGVGLSAIMPPEQMSAWGWRVPFFIGCMIVPLLFWLRRSLAETEAFLAQKHHPDIEEILASLATNWKIVVLGVLFSTMTTVCFYLITAYTPTYGIEVLHLTSRQSLLVTFCVGMSNFFWLPAGGALSDIVGRRPILIGITCTAILTAYPAMLWLVSSPSTARLLIVELWLSIFFGVYNGAMIPHLAEIMPPEIRTSGFSLAFSLATAIFGGFTPAICTYLIHETGNRAMPALWLSFAALCGLAAALVGGWQRAPVAELKSEVSAQ
ncbi:MAG TPA: MFS transporter [Candidatus Acidoferrales bacterium]|jgi:metabolite-proton symporter|nr:MFS transporter [Candidatus Acidoferrales bacterium]